MFDPTNLPYAKWLEASIHNMIEKPVESICIISRTKDGEVLNGYYNCSISDKLIFSGYINQDAMLDDLVAAGLVPDEYDESEYDESEEDIYDE